MALNFPNTGLYPGLQYTGDNGVVYIYDGVKWVGHAPTLAPGTSSLVNGSNVVQVDGAGNLVIPDGATIIYQSGAPVSVANTGTVWTNNANGCLRAELSSTGFQAFTDASHLDLQDSGEWNIGSYQNSTFIGNDAFSNTNILSLKSGDETYITTNLRENGNHQWKFGVDGNLLLPTAPGGNSYTENKINAGGISIPNSVQLRTLVVGTDGVGITNSEIALEAGNGGFSSQVFGPFTGGADGSGGPTLVYAGVENVSGANGPGFAGFVAIDPNVTSQYVVQGNGLGGILGGGYGATTTKYVASLGTLAGADMGGNLFFNGVSADTTQTTVAGDTGVLIGTNTTQGQQYLWKFDNNGELTLPNGGHLGPVGKGWTGLDGGNGQPVSLLSYYSTGTYAGCVSIYPGNGVQISTYGDGTGQLGAWTFGNDGALSVNSVATIATTPSVSCTATMDTIIYTSISNATTFKLLIKAEGYEGTPTAWDTQSSEMIIAHGFRNNTVVASVYGIIHTSTLPLAIFTAQWNAVTGRVEVLCRPTSLTSPVVVRTFATEIITSD